MHILYHLTPPLQRTTHSDKYRFLQDEIQHCTLCVAHCRSIPCFASPVPHDHKRHWGVLSLDAAGAVGDATGGIVGDTVWAVGGAAGAAEDAAGAIVDGAMDSVGGIVGDVTGSV
ncbi:hypothetical protein BDN71DRAFT_1502930 [Pleurotus eryngii]|uniref:Uncharacterized protein n=1 Tax=Pleurotus eryngii TaxID=5323 RepID=A0A9P6A7G4_PLEER|nr:hypothetical protein BDN71DRAFT_1502930 [Pleurotus eryngii]